MIKNNWVRVFSVGLYIELHIIDSSCSYTVLWDYLSLGSDIEDNGQETISGRWIVMAKEKHDGQKQRIKLRLVARGFQETIKPQSDSPTVSK